ncbi:MAG: sugar nucleotide-binding protein, partial [Calditrichaceae bacterium]
MKKVMIFGSNGLLGQSLVKKFSGDFRIIAASLEADKFSNLPVSEYHQIDMANRSAMHSLLSTVQPDIIINAAAYTNVDKCEIEREQCWNTNVRAVENIVDSGLNQQTIFIHISTDYVFDGTDAPYRESDKPNPRGNYARSKMASENIVRGSHFEYMIIRTQVLYGTGEKVR